MQQKTTRAFRTISEAGEELDLQPHVLRFWESKFSQIKPIKRGGGRRFYRPEDIEFLRGIKILLHDEGHPIKDVQKLIRLKGPGRVMELGQSVEKAAREREVKDTVLIPDRLRKSSESIQRVEAPQPVSSEPKPAPPTPPITVVEPKPSFVEQKPPPEQAEPDPIAIPEPDHEMSEGEKAQNTQDLQEALERLKALKSRWSQFESKKS